jgi:hypothetical protein
MYAIAINMNVGIAKNAEKVTQVLEIVLASMCRKIKGDANMLKALIKRILIVAS